MPVISSTSSLRTPLVDGGYRGDRGAAGGTSVRPVGKTKRRAVRRCIGPAGREAFGERKRHGPSIEVVSDHVGEQQAGPYSPDGPRGVSGPGRAPRGPVPGLEGDLGRWPPLDSRRRGRPRSKSGHREAWVHDSPDPLSRNLRKTLDSSLVGGYTLPGQISTVLYPGMHLAENPYVMHIQPESPRFLNGLIDRGPYGRYHGVSDREDRRRGVVAGFPARAAIEAARPGRPGGVLRPASRDVAPLRRHGEPALPPRRNIDMKAARDRGSRPTFTHKRRESTVGSGTAPGRKARELTVPASLRAPRREGMGRTGP